MINNKNDFPFYNDNPHIRVIDIIILLAAPLFFLVYTFIPFKFPDGTGTFIFFFVELLAFLYVSKGKISLILKKINFRDIVRIIVTLILQIIFSIACAMILKFVFNITSNSNPIVNMDMGIFFWIQIIFQLFAEEMYKIFIFLGVLTVMNRLTKKRFLSVFIALLVSLVLFGVIHATTYNNWIQVILIQGGAAFFCMYNYLKSKNILTSYIQHFLLDAIPFVLAIIGVFK